MTEKLLETIIYLLYVMIALSCFGMIQGLATFYVNFQIGRDAKRKFKEDLEVATLQRKLYETELKVSQEKLKLMEH